MSRRPSGLVALLGVSLTASALVLAGPVTVLSISDGRSKYVASLDPSEPLTYSYRQSIYEVTVFEELAAVSGGIRIRAVRSSDIRSVEYFGWRGEPAREGDGLWSEAAPPTVRTDPELVIRITPAGEQRFATSRWSVALKPTFGEAVVRVRTEERPRLLAMLEGVR